MGSRGYSPIPTNAFSGGSASPPGQVPHHFVVVPLSRQAIGRLGTVGLAGPTDGVGNGRVPWWPHRGCQGLGPFIGGLPPVGQAGPSTDLRLCQMCWPGPAVPLVSPAKLHTSCVLARGDAVLLLSPMTASPEDRASLREVPVTNGVSAFSLTTRRSYEGRLPCPHNRVASRPNPRPWSRLRPPLLVAVHPQAPGLTPPPLPPPH